MTSCRNTVAIVGCGPAGSTAAILLARAGCSVTLFDSGGKERSHLVESIPPECAFTLQKLDLLGVLLSADPVASPGNISAWGSDEQICREFIFSPYGSGWQVARHRLHAEFRRKAEQTGVDIRVGRVISVTRHGDCWQITYGSLSGDAERSYAAKVLWAGGRISPLPVAFNTRRRTLDTLLSIGAPFESEDEHTERRAIIEARPDGWWYAAAVQEFRYVAFFTEPKLIPRHERTKWWLAQLSQTSLIPKNTTLKFAMDEKVTTVCANGSFTDPAAGENWLAIGDAAMALDPLSSSGVMFSLSSAQNAADVILCRREIGDYLKWLSQALDRYRLEHTAIYQREKRWRHSNFWGKRSYDN